MHVQIINQISEFFEMQYHKKGLIDFFNFLDVDFKTDVKNFLVLDEYA